MDFFKAFIPLLKNVLQANVDRHTISEMKTVGIFVTWPAKIDRLADRSESKPVDDNFQMISLYRIYPTT